jgi:hypothetical protein
MAVLLIVIGLVIALATVTFILNQRRQTAPVAVRLIDDFEDGILTKPLLISALEPAPVAEKVQFGWTKQFEPRSGELSDEARLRLINDLGMLGAPWCVSLLVQAYEEESSATNKGAAQLALARCRDGHVT